jgi:membrane-bound acyltransferase YfiQ involved in biofilm formation
MRKIGFCISRVLILVMVAILSLIYMNSSRIGARSLSRGQFHRQNQGETSDYMKEFVILPVEMQELDEGIQKKYLTATDDAVFLKDSLGKAIFLGYALFLVLVVTDVSMLLAGKYKGGTAG